jgi:uncharacterized protein
MFEKINKRPSMYFLVLLLLSPLGFCAATELTAEELTYEPSVEDILNVERLDSGYLDLYWDHLIPKGWVEPMPVPVEWGLSDEEISEQMSENPMGNQTVGPTVDALNGEKVRIPGFILSLDMSEKGIKDFLFVPYVGACLHVPPPPTNQLIAAVSDEYLKGIDMWQPVFLFGTLIIEDVKSELGNSSYSLNIDYIENYREDF